jgi:c-di-GMP-binding flagellar brake protein YcgR
MNSAQTRLAEAIAALQRLSATHNWGDNRRAPRANLRISIPIHSYADGAASKMIQAELQDISARGLALRVREKMEEGSTFLIQLPVENQDKPIAPLICQVIHCRDQKDQTFMIGAEFIGQVDYSSKDPHQLISEENRIRNSVLS